MRELKTIHAELLRLRKPGKELTGATETSSPEGEREKQNKSKIVKGHSFKSKTTNQIIKLPVFKLWSIHVRRGVDDPGRQTEILN